MLGGGGRGRKVRDVHGRGCARNINKHGVQAVFPHVTSFTFLFNEMGDVMSDLRTLFVMTFLS
jgi:hypothetical protein